MNKLKVVWICISSNPEIRGLLPLSKKIKYGDLAPWITNLAKGFEEREDVELHIISPHIGLMELQYSFEIRGIHYHYFKQDLPFINKGWPGYFPVDRWTNFFRNRILVRCIIKKINPDIVNLHGAENDFYSITALDIKKCPVYVCIQGIYSNPDRFNHNEKPDRYRIKIERRIHKKCTYFGIFPPLFADLIKRDNKQPIFLRQKYIPNTNITIKNASKKKYDFVFWGRVCDVKGIDKIIEAIAFIKNIGINTSFLIIGPVSKDYLMYLQILMNKLNVTENITFTGQFPTINDVHRKAMEARVTVISSRFDNLPETIIESIFLEIPVAATAVGGIPFLNKNEETILLSKYGDIEGLAKNMLRLLQNSVYANKLTQKCREFILREFGSYVIVDNYIKQYHAIIDHYNINKPIPKDLLFDETNFIGNKL
jgi:glycosyltransferase involved in cell wall biosynthesis